MRFVREKRLDLGGHGRVLTPLVAFPMRPFAPLLVFGILIGLASASPSHAEIRSWVDEDGNVHIVDDDIVRKATNDAGASRRNEKRANDTADRRQTTTYRWVDAQGQLQITNTPPPKSGRLLSKSVAAVAAPSPNVARKIATLRMKAPKGRPFPRIVGKTVAGTPFDSDHIKDRALWAAFVTMTCRHCRIEASVVRDIAGEFAPQSFVFFVKGGPGEAAAFCEATGVHPTSVVPLSPKSFPNGAVPLNVIVDDNQKISRAFTGRLPARALAEMAERELR